MNIDILYETDEIDAGSHPYNLVFDNLIIMFNHSGIIINVLECLWLNINLDAGQKIGVVGI